jgi:hypothetical protein
MNRLAGAWCVDIVASSLKGKSDERSARPSGKNSYCDWVQMLLMIERHAEICGAVSGKTDTIGLGPAFHPVQYDPSTV